MDDSDGARRATAVTAVASVFMSIACVAVLLRIYVRGFLIKAFGWDDATMVIAMVLNLPFPFNPAHPMLISRSYAILCSLGA